MTRWTLSAADRVAACPASAVLPASRSETAYSSLGVEAHAVAERAQSVGIDEAIAGAPDEYRDALRSLDWDAIGDLLGGRMTAEIAVAIDLETGAARELGRGSARDYSRARDSEVCGTMDLGAIGDGLVYVGDLKTGHSPVPPARVNRQLRGYLYAMLKIYGGDRAIGELVHVRTGRDAYRDRAEFDDFDLLVEFLIELRRIDAGVRAAQAEYDSGRIPDVAQGDHCRWCPARTHCPARVALASSLASPRALEAPGDLLDLQLTADAAPEALRRVRLISALCKDVQRQIDDYAWSDPIPLGDGRYYGPVDRTRDVLDGDAVYSVMQQAHGPSAAEAAAPAERKATKRGIDAALRALKDAGAIKSMAPARREILGSLVSAGGLESRSSRSLAEYSAPECSTPGCGLQAMTTGGTCRLCALDAADPG